MLFISSAYFSSVYVSLSYSYFSYFLTFLSLLAKTASNAGCHIQKHKRFHDIRNEYMNEVEQLAQRRHLQQQQQKQQQRRMSAVMSGLSVCLSLHRCSQKFILGALLRLKGPKFETKSGGGILGRGQRVPSPPAKRSVSFSAGFRVKPRPQMHFGCTNTEARLVDTNVV